MTKVLIPEAIAETAPVMQELARLLDRMRLYSRERQIESILRIFDFPAMHPRTVLLLGEPESCPYRFITGFANLLSGLSLPIAQVVCQPERREIPNGLLLAVLGEFLTVYPRSQLDALLGPLVLMHGWLGRYFPVLQLKGETPPVPPADPGSVNHVLTNILQTLVRTQPHLAIIHHLHDADAASLQTLQTLHNLPRHGLRLLASADPTIGQHTATWTAACPAILHQLTLPSYSPASLCTFLGELAPELSTFAVAERLHQVSGGQPLLVETTLRSWILDGTLTRPDRTWRVKLPVHPERIDRRRAAGTDSRLTSILDYLAQAALAGSTSHSFLSVLWRLSPEETAALVHCGRLLGYLAAPLLDDTERVDFADLDYQDSLIRRLRLEQQDAYRHTIRALKEDMAYRQQQQRAGTSLHTSPMASGGEIGLAGNFLLLIQEALQQQRLAAGARDDEPAFLPFHWRIDAPQALDARTLEPMFEALSAIRLLGVQCRLYPPGSRTIGEFSLQAEAALARLFVERTGLTLTSDGTSLAVDGRLIQYAEIPIAYLDYRSWLESGHLQAVGLTRGITAQELQAFFQVLVAHDPSKGCRELLEKIAALRLHHLQVLSWHSLLTASQDRAAQAARRQPAFTHQSILAFLGSGTVAVPAADPGYDFPERAFAPPVLAKMPPVEDFLITANNWQELPTRLASSPPSVRSLLLGNLCAWIQQQYNGALLADVDRLTCLRIVCEDDSAALAETLRLAGIRINTLLEQGLSARAHRILLAIHMRNAHDHEPQLHRMVAEIQAHLATGPAYAGWLEHVESDTPQAGKHLQTVVRLLGKSALHPLLAKLQQQERLQDAHLLHLWELLGRDHQAMLSKELRTTQLWYYARNLLVVLGRAGTQESLGAISEKCLHSNALIRREALIAAVNIAGEQAFPYISHAFTDVDAQVRTLAATFAGRYPHARLLPSLLTLLSAAYSTPDVETEQVAACTALGHYQDPDACTALLRILHPPLLARPSVTLRCAALAALTPMCQDPAARRAIQRARHDREPTIRAAAERAWQEIAGDHQ